MAWKFVITNKGYLRMGDVKLHRDLLWPDDWCLGGGFYRFDYVNKQVILDRESYDYGRPQWSKLVAAGIRLRVPKEYEGFAFVWQEGSGRIQPVNLSDWLGIDWVTSPHE